jgi:hypothetical protein
VLLVAGNVALLEPAATVTDAGTPRIVVLEVRLTLTPLILPAPAVPLRLTVQTLEACWPSEVGEHARLLIVNPVPTEIAPPAALTAMPSAAGDAPSALLMPIDVPVPPVDRPAETVATTPSPIVPASMPTVKQV